jgi:SAM-dependent methyltransferase
VRRPEGDNATQSAVLEDLAEAVNYRRWLVEFGLPYLDGPTLEVGSGRGDHAADWADQGVAMTASEGDPGRLAALRDRFGGDPRVEVRELAVPLDVEADYASVVAYNVLEHIPDDLGALRAFARLLRPGGRVVLIVPALPVLMSSFDRAIGHQRRYRRTQLADLLERAGLEVERLHYLNAPGALAWFIGMRLLRMTPAAGSLLRAWDSAVIPVARWIERRWTPPFGQSLFAVATNPAMAAGTPGAALGYIAARRRPGDVDLYDPAPAPDDPVRNPRRQDQAGHARSG